MSINLPMQLTSSEKAKEHLGYNTTEISLLQLRTGSLTLRADSVLDPFLQTPLCNYLLDIRR